MDRREALSVLGLGEDASDDEIRRRWREMIAQLHPDTGGDGDPIAIERLTEARTVALGLTGTALALRDVTDVVAAITRPLLEREELRDAKERTAKISRELLRVRVSPLKRNQRRAGVVAAAGGAVAVIAQIWHASGLAETLSTPTTVAGVAWGVLSGTL